MIRMGPFHAVPLQRPVSIIVLISNGSPTAAKQSLFVCLVIPSTQKEKEKTFLTLSICQVKR